MKNKKGGLVLCAILGGNNRKWDYQAGIDCMKHRGPDGIRIEFMEDIIFAFARLAIIDLSSNGMQPMFSTDKKVCIVFNGEIYKYKELRKRLEKKYCFCSETDTEVLLYAYMEYGDSFIDKIDGMFAIAIYDKHCQKIKLFRDRTGIKPLYYYVQGYEFGFSSELKGLVNMINNRKLIVDKTAVYDYLTYTYIPEPKSIYKDIYKLEPASSLVYDVKRRCIEKKVPYWKLKVNPYEKGKVDFCMAKHELRSRISAAVKAQMVADVPVGTLLSGGMDSSVITFEGCKLDNQIQTFSMGFTDKTCDELKYAHQLVNLWNLNNHEKIFGKETFTLLYANMREWFDEPYADISAFPTYSILQLAKEKGMTVLLTGDGGDEVFGGYNDIYAMYEKKGLNIRGVSDLYEKFFRNRFFNESIFDPYFLDDAAFFSMKRNWTLRSNKKKYVERLQIPKDYDDYWFIRKHYHRELPPITRAQVVDFHTFLPFILNKTDRTSMALSMEVRVPLLDQEIIEYSFSLPQEIRCHKRRQKDLLKKSYPEIPHSIKYRAKQGFAMPGKYISEKKHPCEAILNRVWREVLG